MEWYDLFLVLFPTAFHTHKLSDELCFSAALSVRLSEVNCRGVFTTVDTEGVFSL